jgi:hypothetical protein
MVCEGCGNKNAYRQLVRWHEVRDENGDVVKRIKIEVCNECSNQESKPQYFRDASGQRVQIPTSELGRFSYATGTPILSTRQYADTLKRMGLSQKGT